MKIRNGFVSNSSSSSFLIYGIEIEDIGKFADNINLTDKEKESLDEEGYWYLSEILDEKNIGSLEYFNAYDGEYHYVGRSWDTVGDNETGKEFKDSIENKLKGIMGDDIKCGTLSEAWMG